MKNKVRMLILFRLVMLAFVMVFSVNVIMAQNTQNTATVYIIRKSVFGAAFKFTIIVNDNQIGKLGTPKYFKCVVPAGDVAVKALLENEDELHLFTEPGKEYFVLTNATMGLLGARISLAKVNEKEGRSLLAKCKEQTNGAETQEVPVDMATMQPQQSALQPTQQNQEINPELYAASQKRYAVLKKTVMEVSQRQQELFLSDKDHAELNTLNEMLSDVNRVLYNVSGTSLSVAEKSQKLANAEKAMDVIERRLNVKYSSILAINTAQATEGSEGEENPSKGTKKKKTEVVRNSDVDINVPISGTRADNTFVLIIANENYEFVDDVQFALNDGEAMREYCIKTLGVPERQVWFYKNASAGIIAGGVDKMVQAMDIFDDAKAIVYYCGHGIPDEKTGDAYLVPTDGKGTNVATCYSLNKLYKILSGSKAKSVTYFMDACFTGANRDGSMLVAARGVAREAKKETIEGNTVVFSAASGDETAMPYKEKQHGLFTYFLLKKIQETKGDVSYGELADYIKTNVKKEAFLTNEKPQNPVIATSEQSLNTWKSTKLK